MVIFLPGCWVYKMTELCLPWTWGCPLAAFSRSARGKLWHCGQKASGESLGGKALEDKKCFVIWPLRLMDLSSDLAEWSQSEASTCSKAWTALNGLWIPSDARSLSGSGATKLPVRQSRWNVAQLRLWLHFPTPPYPTMISRWHAVSATLSSQWLVWGLDGCACGEPVPALFSQDKLDCTSSGLIKPLVSKIVT